MVESLESSGGTDAVAVERTLAGDSDAFRVLVERHSRSLFRMAYRMTGNAHDAEEVVQESFLRAYQKLRQFESRANFGTWVYRIATNCAWDRIRKRRSEESHRESPGAKSEMNEPEIAVEYPDGRPAPDRLAASAELRERMQQALRALSPAERAAVVMRHWEGRGIEEIAKTLQVRSGAAKNTVFRAVEKLRQSLAPFVEPRGAARSPRMEAALGAAPGTEL